MFVIIYNWEARQSKNADQNIVRISNLKKKKLRNVCDKIFFVFFGLDPESG
jgi:hypothetical protein